MVKKISKLTTTGELISILKEFDVNTKVTVLGTQGYMYKDDKENIIIFDDCDNLDKL